jgi:DNA polymerase
MDNIREIMEWYVEAGVDVLLEDAPIDRFSEVPPPPRQKAKSATRQTAPSPAERLAQKAENSPRPAPSARPQTTLPDSAVVDMARSAAAKAMSLEDLKQAMASFDGCNLKRTAKSLVFADGNPEARIMLIGEAPGKDEDMSGLPFVGRAGQLLDKQLAAIGLDRTTSYITNVIPWRPPGNRTPTPQETEICRPFIERHIELINPDVILMLGGSSAKTLLKTSDGIMKLRGKWSEIKTEKTSVKALPTLHPAYLLRQPLHKRLVWQDLLALKQHLIG